jgi:hypothetical protein
MESLIIAMENSVPANLFSEFQVLKGPTGGEKSLEYSVHNELVNARIISGIC